MPAFRNRVIALALEHGAHKVHKAASDERLAMTPEDLADFALDIIYHQKELIHAANRDCHSPRRYKSFVHGWWDRYCEDLRREESGAPGRAQGSASGD